MKKFFIIMLAFLLSACVQNNKPLKTVSNVELEKYMGTWYEIASLPNSFQKGCFCTKATYKLKKDYVSVTNSCRKDSITGELNVANGKAWPVKASNNSKLKVQFFWPFKGDYWILYLDKSYQNVIVGSPNREYLWFLSRHKTMNNQQYQDMLFVAKQKLFDINKLRKTTQC